APGEGSSPSGIALPSAGGPPPPGAAARAAAGADHNTPPPPPSPHPPPPRRAARARGARPPRGPPPRARWCRAPRGRAAPPRAGALLQLGGQLLRLLAHLVLEVLAEVTRAPHVALDHRRQLADLVAGVHAQHGVVVLARLHAADGRGERPHGLGRRPAGEHEH